MQVSIAEIIKPLLILSGFLFLEKNIYSFNFFKLMSRKAQLTIFVIFGLIILAALTFLFFYKENIFELYSKTSILKSTSLSPQVQEIDSFVKSCIKDVGYEALYATGMQGGYFIPPKLSTELGVPYYFVYDKSYVPQKQTIETEIASYINSRLFFCTKNFASFKSFDIDQGRIVTRAEIKDNEVVLSVNYPITIAKDDTTFKLKTFKDIKIPIRLGLIYKAMNTVIKYQLEDKTSICISCLANMPLEDGMHIDMIDYGQDTIIFTIRDENTKEYKKPYMLVFANKYKAT